jgi:GMP synthase-like glutamine amidotransferase
MRVLVVRHHDIDEAGFIEDAFVARGAEITVHLVPDDGPLPPLDGVDHVVLLGAVWSVYDAATIGHWIGAELDWLREADRAGVPVLGICFGAQALSAAMGGQVEPVGYSEVGWTTVESLDPEIIEPGPWMEFHNDRCLPPARARLLARNQVGVQAFSVGRHLAVQFHPEVDGEQLKRWLDSEGARAQAERAGQDPDELVALTIEYEPAAARRADRLVAAALRLARATPAGSSAGS